MSEDATLDEFIESEPESDESSKDQLARKTVCGIPPTDWSVARLGEVVNVVSGNSLPNEYQDDSVGEHPVYKVSDMNEAGNEKYVTTSANRLDKDELEELNHTLYPEQTTILPKVGAALLTNKRRLLTEPSSFDNNVIGWVPDETNPEFLYYVSCMIDMKAVAQKGAVPSISKAIAKSLKVPSPPLSEQRKIATVLYTIDQAIQKTEEISQKLSTIRQGLRQDIFSGRTGNQTTKTTRTGPISVEIPEHWEIKNMGDFVDEFIGGATLSKNEFTESGTTVLPKKAINESGIAAVDSDERQYCSDETAKENQTNIVNSDYLITALRDLNADAPSIGRIVEIDTESGYPNGEQYLLAQGVHGLRTSSGIDEDYLIELSNSGWYRRYVKSISVGSTQIHIRNGEFLGIEIPVPPREEQEEIATQLREIVRLQSKERVYKQQLQCLKQGLMQDLLSGNVRTTDTNIEVPDEIAQHG